MCVCVCVCRGSIQEVVVTLMFLSRRMYGSQGYSQDNLEAILNYSPSDGYHRVALFGGWYGEENSQA